MGICRGIKCRTIGSDGSGDEGLIISRVLFWKDMGSCNSNNINVWFLLLLSRYNTRASKMIDDNACVFLTRMCDSLAIRVHTLETVHGATIPRTHFA